MRQTVKVIFDDGNSLVTDINGTEEEVRRYYLGNWFNLGTDTDDMHQVTGVEFLTVHPEKV